MEYRKFADTYVIRLDKGEEIISSLQAICEKENIRLGSVGWALLQEKTAQCICICTSTCAIRKCRSWAAI